MYITPRLLLLLVLAIAILTIGCSSTSSSKISTSSSHALDDIDEVAASTLTEIGQQAPDFSITCLDGSSFTLAEQKGKVVLINFFATWCGPCKAEMPYLEVDVWQRFKDRGLIMVSIGREEKKDDIAVFRDDRKLTFRFASDLSRKVYQKYASAYIPRNYVIGHDGSILYQSHGFEPAEFERMIEVIADALDS